MKGLSLWLRAVIVGVTAALVTAALGACAAPAAPSAEKTWKLKSQGTVASTTLYHKLSGEYYDQIQKVTKGRVVVDPRYAAEELVPVQGMYDALSRGALDIMQFTDGYMIAQQPWASYANAMTPDQFNWAWDNGNSEIVNSLLARDNVRIIADWSTLSERSGAGRPRQLKTLEDFKGLKFRVPTKSRGVVIEALGGTAMVFPMAEAYTALQSGLIDYSFFITLDMIYSQKLQEIAKYVPTSPPDVAISLTIMINQNLWNSFPPDIQKAISDLQPWIRERYKTLYTDFYQDYLKKLRAGGADVYEWPPDQVNRWKEISMKLGTQEILKQGGATAEKLIATAQKAPVK